MPITLPTPIVVRPAQEEILGDKVFIQQLVIDANTLDDNNVRIYATIRLYGLDNDGNKVFSDKTINLNIDNLFEYITQKAQEGSNLAGTALTSMYAALLEMYLSQNQ